MKGKFKRGKSWCDSCDMNIVAHGVKCGVCGNRQYAKKQKKPTSKMIEKEIE